MVVAVFVVGMFDYHMKLHYSQTDGLYCIDKKVFDYHIKLHYSQTFFSLFNIGLLV